MVIISLVGQGDVRSNKSSRSGASAAGGARPRPRAGAGAGAGLGWAKLRAGDEDGTGDDKKQRGREGETRAELCALCALRACRQELLPGTDWLCGLDSGGPSATVLQERCAPLKRGSPSAPLDHHRPLLRASLAVGDPGGRPCRHAGLQQCSNAAMLEPLDELMYGTPCVPLPRPRGPGVRAFLRLWCVLWCVLWCCGCVVVWLCGCVSSDTVAVIVVAGQTPSFLTAPPPLCSSSSPASRRNKTNQVTATASRVLRDCTATVGR